MTKLLSATLVSMMLIGEATCVAAPLAVGTLNLYHYPVHHADRVQAIEREARGAKFPTLMGFQEAAEWPHYESLYAAIARVSGGQVQREKTNDLKFASDGIAIMAPTTPNQYHKYELPAASFFSKQDAQFAFFDNSPVGPLLFVNIHTSPSPWAKDARLKQVQFIDAEIARVAGSHAVIWVGDFNDDPDSAALTWLAQRGWRDSMENQGETYVYGNNPYAIYPVHRRLDYILYKPAQLRVISAQRRFDHNVISDHYGLSTVFDRAK